jgi:hypothetical protein
MKRRTAGGNGGSGIGSRIPGQGMGDRFVLFHDAVFIVSGPFIDHKCRILPISWKIESCTEKA